jgi:hypothetical protein
VSWSTRFPGPIVLPDGDKLVALQDTGSYIAKYPKPRPLAERYTRDDPGGVRFDGVLGRRAAAVSHYSNSAGARGGKLG